MLGYGTPAGLYSTAGAVAVYPMAATSRYQYENLDLLAQFDYEAHSPSSQYDKTQFYRGGEESGPYNSSHSRQAADQRRIIIKHLGHNTSEDQVRKMVKGTVRKLTADKSQLQHIDFPRARDGRLRGHVYVTFKSRAMAQLVADDLNGRPFQRRHLEARLTGDGVRDPTYDSSQQQSKEHRSSDKHKDRSRKGKEKKEKSKGRGRENESMPTHELLGKLRLDDWDRAGGHERRRIQPVIADGSSGSSRSPDSQRWDSSGPDS